MVILCFLNFQSKNSVKEKELKRAKEVYKDWLLSI
jgi:hypothetical protein